MARFINDLNEVPSGITYARNNRTNAETTASRETESYLLIDLAKRLYDSATSQDFKLGRERGANGDPGNKLPISSVDFQPQYMLHNHQDEKEILFIIPI